MKRNQNRVRKNANRSAAHSQPITKPNPAYVEMARVAASLKVLTGKPYTAALSRMGDLFTEGVAQERAERLAAGTVTCVWTRPDGSEFARVDFERELWSRIKRAASEMDITLQQLFDNAVHDYCVSEHNRRAA